MQKPPSRRSRRRSRRSRSPRIALSYTRLDRRRRRRGHRAGAEPGEVVGAGRMIVQVAREGSRDAVFDVPGARQGRHVAQCRDHRRADRGSEGHRDRHVCARSRRAPIRSPARSASAIKLNNPPAAMRLGTTVTGRMQLASAPSIEIPPSAVVRNDRQAAVWVVDPKTGTVASRTIEIRSSDPNRVEVASGLNPGDVVVTAGVQALRPGQKVRAARGRRSDRSEPVGMVAQAAVADRLPDDHRGGRGRPGVQEARPRRGCRRSPCAR